MRISNRVKQNISLILFVLGLLCIISRIWDLILSPSSGWNWAYLICALVSTYIFAYLYFKFRRRVRQGIIFDTN